MFKQNNFNYSITKIIAKIIKLRWGLLSWWPDMHPFCHHQHKACCQPTFSPSPHSFSGSFPNPTLYISRWHLKSITIDKIVNIKNINSVIFAKWNLKFSRFLILPLKKLQEIVFHWNLFYLHLPLYLLPEELGLQVLHSKWFPNRSQWLCSFQRSPPHQEDIWAKLVKDGRLLELYNGNIILIGNGVILLMDYDPLNCVDLVSCLSCCVEVVFS